MRRLIRSLAGPVGVLGVLASLLVVPSPAAAYGNLAVDDAMVDTGDCDRLEGDLLVITQSGGCRLNDSADNTFFRTDPGGRALKVELHDDGMVAKVEFHPYGEYFWIYDTREDGDSIHVELWVRDPGEPFWDAAGVYTPPGTSDPLEYTLVNKSIPEGHQIFFNVFDDSGLTDLIYSSYVGRA